MHHITLQWNKSKIYQMTSTRPGKITHLKHKLSHIHVKQPERGELAKRMIKEKLTGHAIERETIKIALIEKTPFVALIMSNK